MREGPIEPGSIRELIVSMYWFDQRNAELAKNMALIHASIKSEKTEELASKYMQAFMPYSFGTNEIKKEEMETELNRWISGGDIAIPRSAVSGEALHGKNRAIKKFAGMRERGAKVARRRSSLSGRDRSPPGRGSSS
jgi:hypothetical protein